MRKVTFLIALLIGGFTIAQIKEDSKIIDAYNRYFESPREYTYVHLNKNRYLFGEQIGFSAYVFDAFKKPSLAATNLYCTITDSTNKIRKKKLLMVQKGVVHNVFETDSLLGPGIYTFNAYTNWQRNFKEKLSFSKQIEIIDSESFKGINLSNEIAKLDIQVFPESGHFLQNIENTIGVIIKNQYQKSVDIRKGSIITQRGDTITTFKLDENGIGRALLRPVEDDDYYVYVQHGNFNHKVKIEGVEKKGVILRLQRFAGNIIVNAVTNLNTWNDIKDDTYFLALHNTKTIRTWTFEFSNGPRLELILESKDFLEGMNILTLFSPNKTPIAERLFFNHNLPIVKTANPIIRNHNDSVNVAIRLPNADPKLHNKMSVSILPLGTKSYDTETNIVSNLFLRPYVKGYIQNASNYFSNKNGKTIYDLDNLLITQGWSSYSWNAVFNATETLKHPYEQGISFRANSNTKNFKSSYIIQPMRFTKSLIFDIGENDKYFEATPLFPIEGDQIKISKILSNGKLEKPKIVPSFSPNNIPELEVNFSEDLGPFKRAELIQLDGLKTDISDVQELEEVKISANSKRTRYENLKKLTRGDLDIFDDVKRNAYADFATYIASKGFVVNQNINRVRGEPLLKIYNTFRNRLGEDLQSPLVILDGIILDDLSVLYNFKMDIVDYIEVDKSGASMGMRGANGVIRIVTDPSKLIKQRDFKSVQTIDFPLKFSQPKDYYVPKYQSTTSDFYKAYGVINWIPNLELSKNSDLEFSFIPNKGAKFLMFIEGFANEGELVAEELLLSLD